MGAEVLQNLDRVSMGRLALIYNESLSLGYVPEKWRGAEAVLILKIGPSKRGSHLVQMGWGLRFSKTLIGRAWVGWLSFTMRVSPLIMFLRNGGVLRQFSFSKCVRMITHHPGPFNQFLLPLPHLKGWSGLLVEEIGVIDCLSKGQHAFRKGKSTTTCLSQVVDC